MRDRRPPFRPACLLSIVLGASLASFADAVVTNIGELIERSLANAGGSTEFRLTGTLLDGMRSPAFACENRAIVLFYPEPNDFPPHAGDVVTLTGVVAGGDFDVRSVTPIGKSPIPKPAEATPTDIQQGRCLYRLVTTRGIVTDAFWDDIDAGFLYLLISADGATICAATRVNADDGIDLRKLLGAEVRVRGVCLPSVNFQRPYLGCVLRSIDRSTVEVVRDAATDPMDFPPLDVPPHATPQRINSTGRRHVRGTVLAVSADKSFLMRDREGKLHRIRPIPGQIPPKVSDRVIAGGLVQTDFYYINLSHAIHRTCGRSNARPDEPVDVTAAQILFNDRNERQAMPRFYGSPIRLTGKVAKSSSSSQASGCLQLDCDSVVVPVDISAAGLDPSDFPAGAILSAAGICLMNVENWSADRPFPRITGFTLVARSADDIRILKGVPWWTPVRILAALATLLVLLVAITAWNVTLNRQVRRRTLELVRAKAARDRYELKTDERTRLAVELHDSLSQNLSGLGCQLIATQQALHDDAKNAERCLATADAMLMSTRAELKRCLFDLRNNALEESDFETAIRQTLAPVVGTARITLRFPVPRSLLDDSQAHALLSIVRELTSNAIRHGSASNIRIAGCRDADTIAFSVRDDGAGFDPATCGGPLQGHFGLSGIRTRVKKMNGSIEIESNPGKGTNVKITLRV